MLTSRKPTLRGRFGRFTGGLAGRSGRAPATRQSAGDPGGAAAATTAAKRRRPPRNYGVATATATGSAPLSTADRDSACSSSVGKATNSATTTNGKNHTM
jgi:hypothetical protein